MAAKKTSSSGSKKPSSASGQKAKSSTASKPARQTKAQAQQQEQTLQATHQRTAILLFASAALLFFIAAIRGDSVWNSLHNGLFGLFGVCAWALPIILLALAVLFARNKPLSGVRSEFIFAGVFAVILGGIIHVGFHDGTYLSDNGLQMQITDAWKPESIAQSGGVLGALIGAACAKMFGKTPAMITMIIILFVSFMLFSGTTLLRLYHWFADPVRKVGTIADARLEKGMQRHREMDAVREEKRKQRDQVRAAQAAEQKSPDDKSGKKFNPDIPVGPAPAEALDYTRNDNFLPDFIYAENDKTKPVNPIRPPVLTDDLPPLPDEPPAAPVPDIPVETPPRRPRKKKEPQPAEEPVAEETIEAPPVVGEPDKSPSYRLPPIDCLAEPVYNAEYGNSKAEEEQNAALLIKTLESFNVKAEITGVFRGPSVTRYELVPAEGVKISKITNLADDIALRLAASGVRIEAPIPNKAAIGIEVPNRAKASVTLREIIDTDVYRKGRSKSILNVALGKDIAGNVICADLAKMPHLLIAGTTGSGKSVCVNSMIMSILYNADPTEVKLLMIDPKQVEFTVYAGIPHLLVPVVSDPRKASGALGWAVTEMLGRYKKFSERNVRDISGYNRLADDDPEMERMSRIVIFIDELSDLMMVAQNEVEDAICRLAQMARAAGMHLVIATQRPSVDVITGLIKANIPSRIALSVSSQIDSRTILDTAGAEKLLGYGDMLFSPVGMSKPLRVQGCFVSEREVEEVVSFIRNQEESSYDEAVMDEIEKQSVVKKKGGDLPAEDGASAAPVDDKLQKAIEVVVEAGMASTTLLQRKLSLGYARAARLIDELEERKIVGPFEGSKPRKVLISKQQWMEMCATSSEPTPPADDAPPFDVDDYEDAEDDFA